MTALIIALITAIQITAPAPLYEPGVTRPTGYEKGVSAMFAGAVGDTIVMAGGANFPDVPAADGGRKHFYYEIFTKHGENREWQFRGTLPQPLAYGMSVPLGDGLLCIGGTGYSGQSRQVFKIRTGEREIYLIDRSWPDLPAAVSESAAAIIGSKVYVAGGIADGKPSATVWMLDTESSNRMWIPIAPLPSPAVQPVMASSNGKLYLWYGCNTATGEVSGRGLCYDPDTDSWTPVAPHPAGGTFTGAVSATIPDGRIFCAGGVDREIFAEALKYNTREQIREYQLRPQSSYRFQGDAWVYDPATDSWRNCGSNNFSLARAGAGIAVTPSGILVIEGELKPGIRTPQIALIPFDTLR